MGSMIFMIVIIALMIAMMWGSSRKSKQQQEAIRDFRQSLQPGDEVATTQGLLGKIVSVDLEKEQVVIDSEGSLSRWRIQAITKPPIVPAYIHDDEVDENGNPLPENADAHAEVTAAEDDDNADDNADGEETAADDTATQNFAASEPEDEAESKSDSEPEPEDESDKAKTAEKSDDADESDASKASDSTSAKS
ncbi:preprotein translocase subunit YajC [Bifidobacterium sp. 7101]|uniref:preprotein translocase subunit YajC n=1 Tax=Bifidobacterium sp. 7101 TaxID=1394175 RepID=UPI0004099E32|nr:preprotein translocase subunit YajC [Bifidobacterium sp. 7101]